MRFPFRFIRAFSSSTDLHHAVSYCRDLVRKHDYEGYLCALCMPHDYRVSQYILRAFNAETVRIPEQTTHIELARVKIQFWRDVLNRIYQGVS
jgi:NADH dehydrogenase [ubiquinone] 1 alpha subcomplex assembly factor 6